MGACASSAGKSARLRRSIADAETGQDMVQLNLEVPDLGSTRFSIVVQRCATVADLRTASFAAIRTELPSDYQGMQAAMPDDIARITYGGQDVTTTLHDDIEDGATLILVLDMHLIDARVLEQVRERGLGRIVCFNEPNPGQDALNEEMLNECYMQAAAEARMERQDMEATEVHKSLHIRAMDMYFQRYGEGQEQRQLEKLAVIQADAGLTQNQKKHMKEQSEWYIIDADWLRQWRAYSKDGSREPRPGPISNNVLLDDEGVPKPGLERVTTYRGINKQTWNLFVQLYGGGPEIRRAVLDLYGCHSNVPDGLQTSTSWSGKNRG